MIAASTPSRSTGCSVTSTASSGVPTMVRKSARCAHRAVLGEVAAGLAHHPDRRPLDGLAPAGAEEEIVHRSLSDGEQARTAGRRAPRRSGRCGHAGRRPARGAGRGRGRRAHGEQRRPDAGRTGPRQQVGHARARHHDICTRCGRAPGLRFAGQHRPVADDLLDRDAVVAQPGRQLVPANVAAGKEHRTARRPPRAAPRARGSAAAAPRSPTSRSSGRRTVAERMRPAPAPCPRPPPRPVAARSGRARAPRPARRRPAPTGAR